MIPPIDILWQLVPEWIRSLIILCTPTALIVAFFVFQWMRGEDELQRMCD